MTAGDSLGALLGEWRYDFFQPAYGGTVAFTDGQKIAFHKRERPKVALDERGTRGRRQRRDSGQWGEVQRLDVHARAEDP